MSDSVYTGEDFDAKVRKQVEFYFSDSNLQTDRFLWRIYEANDGWVELKTILTFGRMRQYRPEERVIAALKESDKLVLSANEDMIRRKAPLKDQNELKNIRRRNSVHIEGFPGDVSQEQLEEWFNEKIVSQLPKEQAFASIRRIRNRAREFLGVVDVEFKTQEDLEHFLKLDVSYPQGVVEGVEEKDLLKKMSLLRFREMKESGKRFGVNEVTKRRSSFKDSNNKKARKEEKKGDEKTETNGDSTAVEEAVEDTEAKETTEESKEPSKEEASEKETETKA
ncbi:hypothetical protein C7M61_000461 [Candidozyma pseudohaemuli]|uniref:HTH La-type RNA-binding domain-containing protein n=1 Tax=Candidozyma pseudohaemuli TaxID=418784 RepID=A0A2P7YXY8_9ASCO|nr:hypothetical protein C7M61_000461 [[Candida] pseudohaemulonii]PSK40806.1 hypothetical protein C7M61_000461 [[Candida] pseudohaemulonii]